jgi:beta-galactosidase
VVFINGRNLGRYWYIGPQQTLYIPKTFWNRRDYNTVVVFEEIQGIVSN